ncbi:hypothetical protein FRC96_16370 [Lujinxingia vulgaris]|uniref:Uncharacterized protein n=1 Tax=Lujinxingia vulgaris TaxID=2600176 RepID=A0A5C6WVI4_9DELT|nr:hypothetical protein [Lujinxingia vulgaris]TXD32777.1 hypothetical protein FRC96_16370 [Lujinxingia vulgaris]
MSKRWIRPATGLSALGMLMWVRAAHAADAGQAMVLAQGSTLRVLVGLGLVACATLLAYLSPGLLGRRTGVVTGAHYVALGILVVPVGGLLRAEVTPVLEPMMALTVGAIALAAGLRLSPARLGEIGAADLKLGAIISGVGALVMVALPLALLRGSVPPEVWDATGAGLAALGVLALCADDDQLQRLSATLGVSSPAAARAARVSQACALAALLGVLAWFSWHHDAIAGVAEGVLPLVGLGLHLGLGALAGGLAGALLQGRPDDDRMITIVLGVGVTLSAVAWVANLSVVAVNAVAGIIMASMSSESLRLTRVLDALSAPLYVLALFFAGTMWAGGSPAFIWGAALLFVLLRYAGRVLGVAAYRPRLRGLRPDPGTHRALWAPGALGAALVIDLAHALQPEPGAARMVSALILALFLADLLAWVLLRGWLIDISEVDAERRAHSPWGSWQEER